MVSWSPDHRVDDRAHRVRGSPPVAIHSYWDFEDVWFIGPDAEGNDRARLRWELDQ